MADAIEVFLNNVASQLDSKQVKVGFIDGATYPDGTPVAMVAVVQEYGKLIYQPARVQTLEFKEKGKGSGVYRFAKKGKGTFAQNVTIGAHAFWIPPRPFFRNAITKHESEWKDAMVKGIREGISVDRVLEGIGAKIQGDVQESISELSEPIIKNSTWRARKARGNNSTKPLVDTKVMIGDVNYEVGDIESS